jgi:hypothetical protein
MIGVTSHEFLRAKDSDELIIKADTHAKINYSELFFGRLVWPDTKFLDIVLADFRLQKISSGTAIYRIGSSDQNVGFLLQFCSDIKIVWHFTI